MAFETERLWGLLVYIFLNFQQNHKHWVPHRERNGFGHMFKLKYQSLHSHHRYQWAESCEQLSLLSALPWFQLWCSTGWCERLRRPWLLGWMANPFMLPSAPMRPPKAFPYCIQVRDTKSTIRLLFNALWNACLDPKVCCLVWLHGWEDKSVLFLPSMYIKQISHGDETACSTSQTVGAVLCMCICFLAAAAV